MRPIGKPGDASATMTSGSLHAKVRRIHEGVTGLHNLPAGAAGTTATAGAAWTYGSYVELDDGTNVVASKLVGIALNTPSAGFVGEVCIATGAASSEVVMATVPLEVATDAGVLAPIPIPPQGPIAASTRIAARVRTAAGSTTMGVKALLQPV